MTNATMRIATVSDIPCLDALVKESARTLGRSHYSSAQIEGALETAWGVDTQLISDQTYFVVQFENMVVGSGGWSYRAALFGSDSEPTRIADPIDPTNGTARIRAFFVKPHFARKGVGSMILRHCEREAVRHGFRRFELVATLPGKRFYAQHGFVAVAPITYVLGPQLTIEFVRMEKRMPTGQ
jgi:GNAT superfamily N-acetyltransferase